MSWIPAEVSLSPTLASRAQPQLTGTVQLGRFSGWQQPASGRRQLGRRRVSHDADEKMKVRTLFFPSDSPLPPSVCLNTWSLFVFGLFWHQSDRPSFPKLPLLQTLSVSGVSGVGQRSKRRRFRADVSCFDSRLCGGQAAAQTEYWIDTSLFSLPLLPQQWY